MSRANQKFSHNCCFVIFLNLFPNKTIVRSLTKKSQEVTSIEKSQEQGWSRGRVSSPLLSGSKCEIDELTIGRLHLWLRQAFRSDIDPAVHDERP